MAGSRYSFETMTSADLLAMTEEERKAMDCDILIVDPVPPDIRKASLSLPVPPLVVYVSSTDEDAVPVINEVAQLLSPVLLPGQGNDVIVGGSEGFKYWEQLPSPSLNSTRPSQVRGQIRRVPRRG